MMQNASQKKNSEGQPDPVGPKLGHTLGLGDTFYCRARRRRVALHKCLDDYVEANAFNTRRSACWRCPQGRKNREEYANS